MLLFLQCNLIVDPTPYLEKCRKIVCYEGTHCDSFAAYAEECYENGLCVPWRNVNRCPYNCPSGISKSTAPFIFYQNVKKLYKHIQTWKMNVFVTHNIAALWLINAD